MTSPPATQVTPKKLSSKELEEIIQASAEKVGARDYGLRPGDFRVRYWPTTKWDMQLVAGPEVVIRIAHTPRYPHFKELLFRGLERVAQLKRQSAIIRAEDWRVIVEDNKLRFKREVGVAPEDLPRMLPANRFSVTIKSVVEVKDRETGIVERTEFEHGSIFSAILKMKEEVSSKVWELKIAQMNKNGGQDASSQPDNSSRLD